MKNSSGSIILITLILMTALVIMVHSVLRSTTYLILLAQEREHFGPKTPKTSL
ncbi:MAG TPA: hypothetical protein VKU36_02270 [Candidatus Babeliales bacterium]|nr:hypothetical protein [Candidatus Babeliales bacterium]